jgi:threonine dehydrogenase-like Zn-dependent dehydrogenase
VTAKTGATSRAVVLEEFGRPPAVAEFGLTPPGDAVMWASSITCGDCPACTVLREPTLCSRRQVYGVNQAADTRSSLDGKFRYSVILATPASAITASTPTARMPSWLNRS